MELGAGEFGAHPELCFASRVAEDRLHLAPIPACNPDPGGTTREEWKRYTIGCMNVWLQPGSGDIICELAEPCDHELELLMMSDALFPILCQVIDIGGAPLHAGLIEREGMGILLAATGGVGKSTCCRRLPMSWNVLCDDEVLIVPKRSGRFVVHPLPTWSDYIFRNSVRTCDVQRQLPLSAVFFLRQGTFDEVTRVGRGEAAIRINHLANDICGRLWIVSDGLDQQGMKKNLFNNACDLAREIPTFDLRVTLNGQFWRLIDNALSDL